MLRAAAEREFEVIGEAMNRLAKVDALLLSAILIHQYTDVDDQLVWDVVETKLATLSREVGALLENRCA